MRSRIDLRKKSLPFAGGADGFALQNFRPAILRTLSLRRLILSIRPAEGEVNRKFLTFVIRAPGKSFAEAMRIRRA